MTGSIWSVLDIEPTDDRAVLRRAYAARLKVTNPEDDPEGFQRLRAAYDSALSRRGLLPRSEILQPSGAVLPMRPSTEQAVAVAPLSAELEGDIRRAEDDHRSAIERLEQVVFVETPDHDAVRTALDAVLNGPAMQGIDVYDRTRRWFANLLAVDSLGVDLLLDPVMDFFKWEESWSDDGLSPAVFARRRHMAVLRAMMRPGHPYHEAFLALTRSPVGRQLWRNRLDLSLREQVRDVLASAREKNLTQYFNPRALAWWTARRLRRPGLPRAVTSALWIIGGLVVVVGLGLVAVSGNVSGMPLFVLAIIGFNLVRVVLSRRTRD